MRIGVDLGGTKISGVLMDDVGRVLAKDRRESPRGDYRATLDAIAATVDILASRHPGAPVGIGIPGAISPATGLVKNANSTWLIGHPLDRDLAARLARPVRVANDANCFALSEATDGGARGLATVFGVILGTGVGGGVVTHGRCLVGPNAIAGEWGHNPLPWPDAETDGPPLTCYCGKTDCVETFLSGPGLAARHAAFTGERLAPEVVARGDADSTATSMKRYVDQAARALAHVINVLDPDAIVLGGGLSDIDMLYDAIPARWGRYVFSDGVATPLLKAIHGADSGVRGAAWLWTPEEARS
jgi:fructokinase